MCENNLSLPPYLAVLIKVGLISLGLFLVIELALYPRGPIFSATSNNAAEMLKSAQTSLAMEVQSIYLAEMDRRETVSDELIQELRAIHAEEKVCAQEGGASLSERGRH